MRFLILIILLFANTLHAQGRYLSNSTDSVTCELGSTDNGVLDDISTSLSGTLTVDGSASTQPVSGTLTCNAGTGNFTVVDGGGSLTVDGTVAISSTVTTDGSGVTQPVSAASLPLPTGASTAANQSTANGYLATLAGAVSGTEVQVDIVSGGGGGVEYTEGDVDATITGKAILHEIAGNTLATVSSVNPMPVDASGTPVPVTDNGGSLTVDGTLGATQSGAWNITNVSGTVSLPTGAATAAKQLPDGHNVTIQDGGNSITVDGTVGISGTVTVGSHAVTNAGTFATQATLQTATTGGATSATKISAASTNATSTKASAGQLYGYALFNSNAAARYVKFYNKASAPTVGTDTPVLVVMVPGGGGANLSIPNGVVFSTGIAYATTTGAANADTGAVGASEVIINFWYK